MRDNATTAEENTGLKYTKGNEGMRHMRGTQLGVITHNETERNQN